MVYYQAVLSVLILCQYPEAPSIFQDSVEVVSHTMDCKLLSIWVPPKETPGALGGRGAPSDLGTNALLITDQL